MASASGIFCLEGEWTSDLRERLSVEPILRLLEQVGHVKYIHRDVATTTEFLRYIGKWPQVKYQDFGILCLACHGDDDALWLSHEVISLTDLAGELAGRCAGRVIYIGSCHTLNMPEPDLKKIVAMMGAKALVGFRKNVGWDDSAAFEVLLLDRLSRGSRSDAFFNGLHRAHGEMATKLGLVVATKSQVYTR